MILQRVGREGKFQYTIVIPIAVIRAKGWDKGQHLKLNITPRGNLELSESSAAEPKLPLRGAALNPLLRSSLRRQRKAQEAQQTGQAGQASPPFISPPVRPKPSPFMPEPSGEEPMPMPDFEPEEPEPGEEEAPRPSLFSH